LPITVHYIRLPAILKRVKTKEREKKTQYNRAKSWTRPFNAMCGIAAP
jgi:hypothetical protein